MTSPLRAMAKSWRADDEEPFFSRDSLLSTGSVDQVDQPAPINGLVGKPVDQASGSGGSTGFGQLEGRDSACDISRWLAEQRLQVPPEWCHGVARLQSMPAPKGISESRWVRYRYDALRLLCEQGATLHAMRWKALDLFGLHNDIYRRPDCMGVAWLLVRRSVKEVSAKAITLEASVGVTMEVGRVDSADALEAWRLSV